MSIDKQGYFCYISFMCYTLHHSKETLMLSTEDRPQVPSWSERQPGKRAGTVSIIEPDFDDIESRVEKSGTGLRDQDCQPGLRKPTWH
jgi:hypothetical protein